MGLAFDAVAGDAVKAQMVLDAAVFAVGGARGRAQLFRNQAEFGGDAEQRDVAEVAAKPLVPVCRRTFSG